MYSDFSKGIFKENPIFIILLGLCPTLAVSTQSKNVNIPCASVLVGLNAVNAIAWPVRPCVFKGPCPSNQLNWDIYGSYLVMNHGHVTHGPQGVGNITRRPFTNFFNNLIV